ncbi:hypothetical protein [Sphingomonas sp. J315]|uniref:hypothetical protein n=1 Tax=Sphingomonas sp. J315 TaxID=2898433 RepID=UPI0021ADC12A|nr:hypothetical protein [Sphingomonas sp. J315]UUY01250.1 hypothetical protein LRS08_09570 [Sphingomonas sp. J315]
MLIVHAIALAIAQATPTPADQADAKCVFAMTMLGESASATDKPGLEMTMSFFLGKIVGRSGAAMLGPAIDAVAESMQAGGIDGAAKLAEQCASEFERSTGSM